MDYLKIILIIIAAVAAIVIIALIMAGLRSTSLLMKNMKAFRISLKIL